MDRRDFLKAAAGVTACAVPTWMMGAGKPQKFKIGFAATTWLQSNASAETYWKACQEMASVGFHATEADDTLSDLDVVYGDKPSEFQNLSSKYGVSMKGVFYSFALWDPEKMPDDKKKAAHICKFLKAIGGSYIATGEGRRQRQGTKVMFEKSAKETAAQQSNEGIGEAIKGLTELGKLCKEEYGINIAFHPGRGQNKSMIQQILDGTDPRWVGFCADVGHLTGAGFNAVEAVRTYQSRLVATHWKDYDPNTPFRRADYSKTLKGDFVEVGKGTVDFPAVAEAFKDIGYSGWVMLELDRTMTSPVQSAKEMKAYITDKLKLTV
jgi:inosose dehydratase